MYVTASNRQLRLSDAGNHWMPSHNPGTITGTTGNDVFYAVTGDRMIGGLGDDQYSVWSSNFQIVENAGEGVDTLYDNAWGVVTLPANVENMVVDFIATGGIGNSLDNIMIAGAGGFYLDGAGGDDVLVGGAGLDTFAIHAGNGSDAIEQFTPGQDLVALYDYGVTSFAQLRSLASQVGGDVHIALPNGEALVLRDTGLSALRASDFRLSNNHTVQPATSTTPDPTLVQMNGAGRAFTNNGWYILNNAWGAGGLTEHVDYTIGTAYHAADPTDGTIFTWSFPAAAMGIGVASSIRAYPEIFYGPSPYSGTDTVPNIGEVLPVQVGALTGATTSFDMNFGGDRSGYDVSFDLWFTSVPNGGSTTITNEVMIWLHQGDFEAFGTRVGAYGDGGFAGQIYHEAGGTYTAVVANSDVAHGTIDLAALFDQLKSLGILHDSEYLASIQLGAEVVSGQGSLTVQDFSFDISIAGSTGGTVTRTVDGHGAGAGTVQGGTGADLLSDADGPTLIGLGGDDTYLVTHATTVVQEAANAGTDLVRTALASYALPDNVENLTFVGSGSAHLAGNALDNTIIGGDAGNHILGGRGDDTITGGNGGDALSGNQGDDIVQGGAGNDSIWGGQDDDVLHGGGGADSIAGNLGNDIVHGDDGNDTIWGGQGDDILYGDAGDDSLFGNLGSDTLIGGAGADRLTGGGGADTFVFGAISDSTVAAPDTITDFQTGIDHLSLAKLWTGASDRLIIQQNAHGAAVEVDLGGNGTIDLLIDVTGRIAASDIVWPGQFGVTAVDAVTSHDMLSADLSFDAHLHASAGGAMAEA